MGLRYIPDAESAGCIDASGALWRRRVLNLRRANIRGECFGTGLTHTFVSSSIRLEAVAQDAAVYADRYALCGYRIAGEEHLRCSVRFDA
jgi:hypothetical protein